MGASIKHRFEFKGTDPFGCMTFLADSHIGLFYVFRIAGIDMLATRPVTHLAPGILQRRGCLQRYKTAGLTMAGCMTFQASLILRFSQAFFHDLKVLKGTDFGGVRNKAAILPFMTRLAAFASNVGFIAIILRQTWVHIKKAAHCATYCCQQPDKSSNILYRHVFPHASPAAPNGKTFLPFPIITLTGL
jgi:hypothetical protein